MSCEIKVFDPAPQWTFATHDLNDVLDHIENNTIWEMDAQVDFDYTMSMVQTALAIKAWRERQEAEFALYKKLRAKFSPA